MHAELPALPRPDLDRLRDVASQAEASGGGGPEERRARYSASVAQELDEAASKLRAVAGECAAELARLGGVAEDARPSAAAAAAQGQHAPLIDLSDADAAQNADAFRDPYARAQMKRGLAALHGRCFGIAACRMLWHDAARTVAAERAAGDAAFEKALLAHALFGADPAADVSDGTERLHAALFSRGDVAVARVALATANPRALLAARGPQAPHHGPFRMGLRLGVALVLVAWVLWDCLVDPALGKDIWHDPAFKVYRALGNVVLLVVLWPVTVRVWRRAGIDYERLLGIPATPAGVGATAWCDVLGADLCIAFLVSLICFWKALRGVFVSTVPPQFAHAFPLVLFLWFTLNAAHPWKDRTRLWAAVLDTLAAPTRPVAFRDSYVGDVLTSVVRVLVDVAWSFGYFATGGHGWLLSRKEWSLEQDPIVDDAVFKWVVVPLCLTGPLWLRFLQSLRRAHESRQRWPHLGNAGKYALAQTVALAGIYNPGLHSSPAWVAAFVLATCYQFAWDIFMDWNLLTYDRASGRLRLRTARLYRHAAMYYAIAATNLVLRFFWALTLLPEYVYPELQLYLSPFVAAAEICRRSMWGLLRVENEHLSVYGTATAIDRPQAAGTKDTDKSGFQPMGIEVEGDPAASGSARPAWLGRVVAALPQSSTAALSERRVLAELAACAGAVALAGLLCMIGSPAHEFAAAAGAGAR